MTLYKGYELLPLDIALFDGGTNVTTDVGLSDEMKTYYSDYLIDLAEPELIHDQFGQKHPIPKNGGKQIEFRKWDSLPKALKPLTEGVTPEGQKMNMSVITAVVKQYGGFVELSDMLLLTAIDNNLVQATRMIGSQAGRTLDTITREVLNGGLNVLYAGMKDDRSELAGGLSTGNDYLTVDLVRRAARNLKVVNAPRIDGSFVGIIHPDCAYDLMKDPEWQAPHQYVDTDNIYEGEIGRIAGVRFVEASEAKVFHAENLAGSVRELTVASVTGTKVTVDEALTNEEAAALAGRFVIIAGKLYELASATAGAAGAAYLTTKETASGADGDKVYPGEAGAGGRDVYSTLILGADAYGVTELAGGGLEHIVKQLGSGGTTDPLNQRATVGWKATKTAERLVEQYMVRIETASTFEVGAN